MANLKDVKYDAFISYRHSEFDSFVVENLHKKLENFKLPKSVLKKVKNGRTKINRVFRDVDELPLADNLSEPINEALRNSDFLITVCTPRYPQSRWCMKEIETFLQTHNRDHILVVLAEDEPVNSFPEILTLEEVETVDEKGEKVIIRRELEPLAADTRGENKKEVLKAMDTAVLKLAAAMFGLEFDDLRQRKREQKIRRLATVFGGIGAAVLGFAIFATSALIKISKQNEMINEQYAELQDSYAGTMANASRQLIGEGRRKDAVYAVRSVLPDSSEGGYNSSAFNALVSAMNVYKVSEAHSPVCMYEAGSWVYDFSVSYEGNYILLSETGAVDLFDTATGALLKRITGSDDTDLYEAAFCGEEGIVMGDGGDIVYYSIADDTQKTLDIDAGSYLYASPDGYITLAFYNDILYALDAHGEVVYTVELKKFLKAETPWLEQVTFNEGDAILTLSDTDAECYYACVIDEYTGEIKYSDRYDGAFQLQGGKDGDILYLSVGFMDRGAGLFAEVHAIDLRNGKERWEQTIDAFEPAQEEVYLTSEFAFVYRESDIYVIDKKNGELVKVHTISDKVADAWIYEDLFYFVTEDGTVWCCSDNFISRLTEYYTEEPSQGVAYVDFKDGDLYCSYNTVNYVVRYSDEISPFARPADDYREYDYDWVSADEELEEDEAYGVNMEKVNLNFYSGDGKYIFACFNDNLLKIFDTETKECVAAFVAPDDDEIIDMNYNEKAGCYIMRGQKSYMLDEKFNIKCETGYIVGEDDRGLVVLAPSGGEYSIPCFSYEELIREADKYLGDHVPSDETKEKYGIK